MTRAGLTRALLILSLLGAALVYAAVPPPRASLDFARPGGQPPIRGALHIHTARSDGTGSLDEVAAAARRAGLAFVVVTDHGDGTQFAEPSYRSGVLCIDATEISSSGGHFIALGMPRSPYPLAGEPRDVLEDITRFGGMSIAAHPVSDKPDLRWADPSLPVDGLEWLNGDSEWRDESVGSLARTLIAYWFRAPESLALLLDRPDAALSLWDTLTRHRRVVAVPGSDAHARLGIRRLGEPYDDAVALRAPGYEQVFQTFSLSLPGVDLGGDPFADAKAVVAAIRAGHVYSSIDALAAPSDFRFSAASGRYRAGQGDSLSLDGPVELRVETNAPAGSRITLFRDGQPTLSSAGATLAHVGEAVPAVYRAEVTVSHASGRRPVPWIVSNAIYVGRPASAVPPVARSRPAVQFMTRHDDGSTTEWQIERNERSIGALDRVDAVGGKQLSMRYALGGAASENPYVAFVLPAGADLAMYDRLVFDGRSSRPMRISVQLRAQNRAAGERWRRSVYLDDAAREVTVFFDELSPIDPTAQGQPPLADIGSVLFVVDGVNTALGTNGQFWLDNVRYGR